MWLYYLLLIVGAAQAEFTKDSEEEIGLTKHNEFRKRHNSPAMTLDRTMCDEAKAYAAKLAAMGTLEHSNREERHGQGENLSFGCSTSGQSIEEAVTNWYNEVCDPGYNFNDTGNDGTGHFTQEVWKESTVLGIGRAEVEVKKNDQILKCAYIVARYKPAGNVGGQYQDNVLKGYGIGKQNKNESKPQHTNKTNNVNHVQTSKVIFILCLLFLVTSYLPASLIRTTKITHRL